MKIGFFCNEYPPRAHGGIGTFVRVLAEALAAQGHQIVVVEWGDAERERTQVGVRVVTLPESRMSKVAWFINRWRLRRWLTKAVAVGAIDVFEIPEYQGCLPFPCGDCPVVVRLHLAESLIAHLMGGGRGRPLIYWLEKATLRWHRRWIGVSRYILEDTERFFGIAPVQSAVIYNPAPPVDPAALPVIPDKPASYVCYVGSVSERKGALVLAEAMREIFADDAAVSLVYVGPETEHHGAPISQAIRQGLGPDFCNRVCFIGRVAHEYALAWMQGARVVALPSRVEAFSIVPLEAMQLAVPVIYTRLVSGPEVIEHDTDGWLVDPYSAHDLAVAIRWMLNNPAEAGRMARVGSIKARERFNLANCLKNSSNFYKIALEIDNER